MIYLIFSFKANYNLKQTRVYRVNYVNKLVNDVGGWGLRLGVVRYGEVGVRIGADLIQLGGIIWLVLEMGLVWESVGDSTQTLFWWNMWIDGGVEELF